MLKGMTREGSRQEVGGVCCLVVFCLGVKKVLKK